MSSHYSMPVEFTCALCRQVKVIDLTPSEAVPERCAKCRHAIEQERDAARHEERERCAAIADDMSMRSKLNMGERHIAERIAAEIRGDYVKDPEEIGDAVALKTRLVVAELALNRLRRVLGENEFSRLLREVNNSANPTSKV